MANLVRSGWGTSKPPVGARIDWGHPLAQGLVAAYSYRKVNGDVYGRVISSSSSSGSRNHQRNAAMPTATRILAGFFTNADGNTL